MTGTDYRAKIREPVNPVRILRHLSSANSLHIDLPYPVWENVRNPMFHHLIGFRLKIDNMVSRLAYGQVR